MEKILTIVIPAYNVAETIEQAIRSMLVPDEQLRSSLEILVVNDGSSDRTSELCHAFEREYPSVVRVIDKANGGHGSVLNTGVSEAAGKYVRFVDGDDWVVTGELEKQLRFLTDTDVDVVATDYYCFSEKYGTYQHMKMSVLPKGKTLHFSDIYKNWTFGFASITAKTGNLRAKMRKIDEHCYYVDMEFAVFSAICTDTVIYADFSPYVYRVDQASQSVSVSGHMKHYLDHERVSYALINQYERTKEETGNAAVTEFLLRWTVKLLLTHYKCGAYFPSDERKKYVVYLKRYDSSLKELSIDVYAAVGADYFISACRRSGFSQGVYSSYSVYTFIKKLVLPLYKKLSAVKEA